MPYRMLVETPELAGTARLEPVEARVRLSLLVRADGTVGAVDVVVPSGRADLDTAARDAAQQWKFRPAERNGQPIESTVLLWVRFVVTP
jgi:protein TonB